jgi:AsmA-like protein
MWLGRNWRRAASSARRAPEDAHIGISNRRYPRHTVHSRSEPGWPIVSRTLKWGLPFVVVSALLIAGAVALLDADLLRETIARVITQKTGRQLAINGDVRWKLDWPRIRLHAIDVTFANPGWPQEKQMIAASAVEVGRFAGACRSSRLPTPTRARTATAMPSRNRHRRHGPRRHRRTCTHLLRHRKRIDRRPVSCGQSTVATFQPRSST